jgi:hypothetical protein
MSSTRWTSTPNQCYSGGSSVPIRKAFPAAEISRSDAYVSAILATNPYPKYDIGQKAAISAPPDIVMIDPPIVEGIVNSSGVLEPFADSDPTPEPSESESSAPPESPSVVYLDDSLRAEIYSYFYLPPLPITGGRGRQDAINRYKLKYQFRQSHLLWPHV